MRTEKLNGKCNIRPLRRYLERHGISQGEFARRIGKTQSTVSQWLNGGMYVSASAAKDIEEKTDGEVKRSDILPELFV
jgi:DNA-binding transcriptional regulator YdaS (Cro superfamily)